MFWKRVQILLYALTLASGAISVSLWEHYSRTGSTTPQPELGRVLPLNSHGVIVYLTRVEREKLKWPIVRWPPSLY
jgi:hypothetical protein